MNKQKNAVLLWFYSSHEVIVRVHFALYTLYAITIKFIA